MKHILAAALALGLVGCENAATVASRNLSQAADNFEITRRIVFVNVWKGDYLLQVEGRCSVETTATLAVTCKIGPNSFKKHFLGLSQNVTWVAEQVDGVDVSTYRYRVRFNPAAAVPDIRMD